MTKARSTKKSTIEIDGRLYDASNGRTLDWSPSHHSNQPVKPTAVSLDGVVSKTHKQRTPAKHAKRQPVKSQTLMRQAVKKPQSKTGKYINEPGINNQKPRRQEKAKEVSRSPQIQHFVAGQRSSTHLQGKQSNAKQSRTRSNHNIKPASHERPVSNTYHNTRSTIDLGKAVDEAQSHLQPAPKKPRKLPRVRTKSSAIAAAVALLLLVGFVAWQNIEHLQVRLAGAKADVPASLPGYKPQGYSLARPIKAEEGKVTLSFKSKDKDDGFDIYQKVSDWSEEALYANYVQPTSVSSQTFSENDRTIYLTDDSSANWVDNGIWYRIESNGELSSDQLIRMAGSF